MNSPVLSKASPLSARELLVRHASRNATVHGLKALELIAWRNYKRTLSNDSFAKWQAARAAHDAAK